MYWSQEFRHAKALRTLQSRSTTSLSPIRSSLPGIHRERERVSEESKQKYADYVARTIVNVTDRAVELRMTNRMSTITPTGFINWCVCLFATSWRA